MKNKNLGGMPFDMPEGDVFLGDEVNAVAFSSNRGLTVCDAGYAKWLILNATQEQYDQWHREQEK